MVITTSSVDTAVQPPGAAPPDSAPADARTIDVRPILPRTSANAWEQTEVARMQLYLLLEQRCARRGIEALVLQSFPYVHPAWVKFESWVPSEPGITARAGMTVSIHTKPYHRFERIYKVEWERHGQSGVVDQLYEFGDTEADRLLDFLCEAPSSTLAGRRVRRMLKPVQLRQQPYQLWRPRNKVTTVRRDRLGLASVTALPIGALLLFAGLQAPAEEDFTTFDPSIFDTIDPAAPAPGGIGIGATVPPPATASVSALDDSDLRLDNGRIYEARTIQAAAGEQITVTMRSDAFDTYLILGQFSGGTFVPLQTNDDNPSDGTNSRIDYVAPTGGEYVVFFSSYESGATGEYSYTVP